MHLFSSKKNYAFTNYILNINDLQNIFLYLTMAIMEQ
jgi:hypothetical protein